MDDYLHTVEQFAKALDIEDYVVAASLLSDDCEYVCRGETFLGPAAIIDSYSGNGTAAKEFEKIEYESSVSIAQNGNFRIRFIDHLDHAGHQLTFQSDQLVRVNDNGLITHIEHQDLPGQREALAEFRRITGPLN